MRKLLAGLGALLFLFLAPGTLAGLLPWWISQGRLRPPFFDQIGFRVLGGILIAAGLIPLLESFARFVWKGLGTPAPVFPTRHLVVSGFYRYVRNPMYLGHLIFMLGLALTFWSWFALVLLVLRAAWFQSRVLHDEARLEKVFGAEYDAYRARVKRWIPGVL